jgi:MFS transporter, FHS family, L-fucose permease
MLFQCFIEIMLSPTQCSTFLGLDKNSTFMKKKERNLNWKEYIFPLLVIAIMFSILGFAVGINAFFVPFVKKAFNINTAMSYLITTATFSAFVLFGIPSGKILKKFGYKTSIIIAFLLMASGMFLIVPAAKWVSFIFFLFALFVNGMGQTLLNAAINPYITVLGSVDSAAQRISIMGACNKLSFGLAPIILAIFMDLQNVQLDSVVLPFYVITIILLVIGVLIYFIPLPEIEDRSVDKKESREDLSLKHTKNQIFKYPHLFLGAFAIFMYVGLENIALTSINDFAIENGLTSPEKYAGYTSIAYVIGYFLGILLIPKVISQINALIICSIIGIVTSLMVVSLKSPLSVYSIVLLGLANSLIWPAIWPLSLADLGKSMKLGASILVMGIVGGGILPPVLGALKDYYSSYQKAYWLLLPGYIYFLFFAIKGYKIRLSK